MRKEGKQEEEEEEEEKGRRRESYRERLLIRLMPRDTEECDFPRRREPRETGILEEGRRVGGEGER